MEIAVNTRNQKCFTHKEENMCLYYLLCRIGGEKDRQTKTQNRLKNTTITTNTNNTTNNNNTTTNTNNTNNTTNNNSSSSSSSNNIARATNSHQQETPKRQTKVIYRCVL